MAVQTLTEARLSFLPSTDQLTCYSMMEVKQHCDHNSCWIVFRDRVYDVTAFLEQVGAEWEIGGYTLNP